MAGNEAVLTSLWSQWSHCKTPLTHSHTRRHTLWQPDYRHYALIRAHMPCLSSPLCSSASPPLLCRYSTGRELIGAKRLSLKVTTAMLRPLRCSSRVTHKARVEPLGLCYGPRPAVLPQNDVKMGEKQKSLRTDDTDLMSIQRPKVAPKGTPFGWCRPIRGVLTMFWRSLCFVAKVRHLLPFGVWVEHWLSARCATFRAKTSPDKDRSQLTITYFFV